MIYLNREINSSEYKLVQWSVCKHTLFTREKHSIFELRCGPAISFLTKTAKKTGLLFLIFLFVFQGYGPLLLEFSGFFVDASRALAAGDPLNLEITVKESSGTDAVSYPVTVIVPLP